MERALARRNVIDVLRIQREARATVLHADARTGYHHTRTEAHVVGLDERDHHAAFVRCREVHRAARFWRAVPGIGGLIGDQARAFCQVRLAQQIG